GPRGRRRPPSAPHRRARSARRRGPVHRSRSARPQSNCWRGRTPVEPIGARAHCQNPGGANIFAAHEPDRRLGRAGSDDGAAGSELTLMSLRPDRAALVRLTAGAIAFPFAVVTLVAWSVSRGLPIAAHQPWLDRLSVALVLGTLAAAASPVITVAMIDELRARGPLARSLLAVTVAQDVAVPLLFAAVLLVSKTLVSAGTLQLTVAGVAALELAGSVTGGVALAVLLV